MRRVVAVLLAAIMVAAAAGPMLSPGALAQSQSVDVWATIDSTAPSSGCSVGVAIEVRSGGGALTDTMVEYTLAYDDGSAMVDSGMAWTDGTGIAWTSFDTSGTGDGAKLWLSFYVNGSYIGGTTVFTNNANSCSAEGVLIDFSGTAPVTTSTSGGGEETSSSDSNVDTSGGVVIIDNVFTYQQQRGLSCEYASLSIATGALGNWVSEYSFDEVVGWSDNPHWGYRGNIYGSWGNTTDYGVYAEPLAWALPQFGFQGYVFYGGGSSAELKAQLAAGHPTLVWLGMWGDVSHNEYAADGTRYQLTAGMHVMTAYGYDDWGVYLSDPGTGVYRYYSWGTFMWMWDVMDGMALAVSW